VSTDFIAGEGHPLIDFLNSTPMRDSSGSYYAKRRKEIYHA
jgi:hypothetical protein